MTDILGGLVGGARNMVSVAVATAAAGIIVGVVTMGLGGLITDIIDHLSQGNIFLMLIITAVASLLLGMGLPTTATYIVMASLTAPVIVHIAEAQGFFVPLIAAHLFCFYFGILADDTPPVGLAAYAASAIAKSDPIKTGFQGFFYDIRTAVLPFMFIFNPTSSSPDRQLADGHRYLPHDLSGNLRLCRGHPGFFHRPQPLVRTAPAAGDHRHHVPPGDLRRVDRDGEQVLDVPVRHRPVGYGLCPAETAEPKNRRCRRRA